MKDAVQKRGSSSGRNLVLQCIIYTKFPIVSVEQRRGLSD
jgi:hypothetical protein